MRLPTVQRKTVDAQPDKESRLTSIRVALAQRASHDEAPNNIRFLVSSIILFLREDRFLLFPSLFFIFHLDPSFFIGTTSIASTSAVVIISKTTTTMNISTLWVNGGAGYHDDAPATASACAILATKILLSTVPSFSSLPIIRLADKTLPSTYYVDNSVDLIYADHVTRYLHNDLERERNALILEDIVGLQRSYRTQDRS